MGLCDGILSMDSVPRVRRYTPYIFTDAELLALFQKSDNQKADPRNPLSPDIIATVYRLIYFCGLRPNEGREIRRNDIDTDNRYSESGKRISLLDIYPLQSYATSSAIGIKRSLWVLFSRIKRVLLSVSISFLRISRFRVSVSVPGWLPISGQMAYTALPSPLETGLPTGSE